jgi:nitrogen regulatory protein PII
LKPFQILRWMIPAKIFVCPLEQVVRIRTGEHNSEAP